MMATPICESMVTDKLLLNTLGAISKTNKNRLQINQRPTFKGLNS
jgi:hypothetical protein